MRTKSEILELVEEEDVEFIRLQFTDMLGNLKNVAITSGQLSRVLDNKYVFDGSSMFEDDREQVEDLYLVPDLDTFTILPWRPQQGKVARMLCDVCLEDGTLAEMSSRTILKKVVQEAAEKGYRFYVDPECEFFLFHTNEDGIPTTVTHEQAGFMDVGPIDLGENARRDIVLTLEEMGFEVESSHHEKAPAQHEIDFKEAEALQTADMMITFKSTVRSIARRFGLHATFMPKPKQGVAGSGLHLNISMYQGDRCLFNPLDEAKTMRDETKWFIGGILQHAKAICAVSNPLVNSYKRITSGFEAPSDVTWSAKKYNTLVNVHSRRGEDTKVEIRIPDPSTNPYLVIALFLAAGMEGVENQITPGVPVPQCYETDAMIETLPSNLREAIYCMEDDEFIERVLGQKFTKIYADIKLQEWNEYVDQVSDWEINKYLNRI